MKKLIRKILKESDKSEWSWVDEINPFQPGNFFDIDDICFNDNTCQVNINDNVIKFRLDWEDWVDWVDLGEENSWYLDPILYHGTNYDGGGDYYEFDSDEFNYSGHHLTNEHEIRFQKILDYTTGGEEKIEDFMNDNTMWDLEKVLKYPQLIELFEDLSSNYLSELGYATQKNRWLSIGREIETSIKETGSDWDLYAGTLEIDVPMEVVWKLYGDGVENLSDLLLKVSKPMVEKPLYDWFYEEYDSDGAEVEQYFNEFLDKAEEFLEESDKIKEIDKKFNILDSLGMKNIGSRWSNKYIRENSNDTLWYATIYHDFEKVKLELYNKNDNRYSTKPIREFQIAFEKLPQYINQYSLKL